LRQVRIRELFRQARFDSAALGGASRAALLRDSALRPLLPQPARRVLRWLLRRTAVPPWVPASFARSIHLSERLRREDGVARFPSLAQNAMYRAATGGAQIHADEIHERSIACCGLEERHPLGDRRLVEFAMALPEAQRWRDDQVKFIVRQAMAGVLPETVRQRRLQAEFSVLFMRAFEALGGAAMFESLAIAALGWVDQAKVRTMYRETADRYARGDPGYFRYLWPLWMTWGIELWFTEVLGGDPRVARRR